MPSRAYDDVRMAPHWKSLLDEEFERPYFKELRKRVREEYLSKKIYPQPSNIFRAFDLCAPEDVRVVILGQDPYHTPGVADGLAFSSFPENPVPPSLENVYKEIDREFGVTCPRTPDLTSWATQGVLLLNTSLTVRSGVANSHAELGWHQFTDAVIRVVSEHCTNVVFMLWGKNAREKRELIDAEKHLVLESAHPSPLSAYKGFFGNDHFNSANVYLKTHHRGTIDWCKEKS